MMKNSIAAATMLVFGVLVGSSSALAATYTLNCVDATTGGATTVSIEASSRADAISKARNDPAYADYDKCK